MRWAVWILTVLVVSVYGILAVLVVSVYGILTVLVVSVCFGLFGY